jgi:hypothetical protein
VNDPIEEADAYLDLGLKEEAKQCVAGILPGDPEFLDKWPVLLRASSGQSIAEHRELVDSGRDLLARVGFNAYVVEWTAQCLFEVGDPESAYLMVAKHWQKLKWKPGLHYSMSHFAAQTARWSESAWHMLACILRGGDSHMFFDLDSERLFQHVATKGPDCLTALAFAHPAFESSFRKLAGTCMEIDPTMERAVPPHLAAHLRIPLTGGLKILSGRAPQGVRGEFQRWCEKTRRRIEGSVAQAIALSRQKVLAGQLHWAGAAARRGDFLAARWHTVYALAAAPDRFDTFSRRLRRLECGYFLDDLCEGLHGDEGFARLILEMGVLNHLDGANERAAESIMKRVVPTNGFAIAAHMVEEQPCSRREMLATKCRLMHRWPRDPAAFANALHQLCDAKKWDAADFLLRRAPRSLMAMRQARCLVGQIQKREFDSGSLLKMDNPFYGQPDIGGLVRWGSLPRHALYKPLLVARGTSHGRPSSKEAHHGPQQTPRPNPPRNIHIPIDRDDCAT